MTTQLRSSVRAGEALAEGLFYQIKVTDPGTRNQGWNGTLYDRNGKAIEAQPGQTVDTRIGKFVSVACTQPWAPCGMIHAGPLASSSEVNIVVDANPSEYRLYVTAEGSKSEGWRGELTHGGSVVQPQFDRVLAPMGFFVWSENPESWGMHGWIPEAWVKAGRPVQKGVVDDAAAALDRWMKILEKKLEVRTPTAVTSVRG